MKKFIKITAALVSAIVLLTLAVGAILLVTIKPNDFKPEIEAAAKNALGREVSIDGDLELSLFPQLGFETGRIALGNSPGFKHADFAEVQHANIKVKLMPLLSKRLEVDRIVLKGLTVHLEKTAKGVGNWEGFSNSESSGEKSFDVSKMGVLVVAGLQLKDASITWDDGQSGQHYSVAELNFESGKFAFNAPMPLEISATVSSGDAWQDRLALKTELSIDDQFSLINLHRFRLDNSFQTKAAASHALNMTLSADSALDRTKQALDIRGLKLTLGALSLTGDLSGEKMLSSPLLHGAFAVEQINLKNWLADDLQIALPPMSDDKVLQNFAAKFNIAAGSDFFELKDLSTRLDDSTLQGQLKVANFSNPFYRFNLALDSIQVDRYLPAQTESAKDAQPAKVAAAASGLLPVDMIRKLQVQGQLQINELKTANFSLGGVRLELKANHGLLESQQQIAQFFQGRYDGKMTVNAKNKRPVIQMNQQVADIKVESLLQALQQEAKLNGVLSASVQLQAQGNTPAELKPSLNGNGQFALKDSVIKGFNLQRIIDEGKALLNGQPSPAKGGSNEQSAFSEVRGSFRAVNGVLHNNDLIARSANLQIDGSGSANLLTEGLDFRFKAQLPENAQIKIKELKQTPIIIDVGGSFTEPSYSLDLKEMALEAGKDKIAEQKDKLLKKLDKKLGSEVGNVLKGLFQ